MRERRVTSRGGFTLVELIVVVVMLGVLGGLVVPRVMSTDRRRAQQTVDGIGALLSIVAQREALGSHRMRVSFDSERGTIRMDALRIVGESGRRGDTPEAVWRRDPLVPEIRLEGVRLADVRFDGRAADARRWEVEFVPGVPRPLVEVVAEMVRDDGTGGKSWLVELLPYAPEADIVDVRAGGAVEGRRARSVDLDAAGRGEESW